MALAVGLAVWAAGCQLGVRVEPPAGGDCRSDFDCPLDALCTVGACVRVPRAGTFDLVLTPPNDTAYPKQQVAGVRLSASTSALGELVLQPAAVLTGRVIKPGGRASPVRARIEASRAGDIKGTSVRVTVATTLMDGDERYRLPLAPGVYDIRVFPEDPTLPPSLTFAQVDATRGAMFDLVLPADGDYRSVRGLVARNAAARLGIEGVLVQALSSTGTPLSALVRTDAVGRFSLSVLKGEASITLRVSGAVDGPSVPIVERARVVLPADGAVDVGVVVLGAFEEPTSLSGRVVARDRDSAAVAGATVIVSGHIGEGQWIEQLTTNSAGEFEASLPPGRYSLDIRPPIDSALAFYVGPLLVPSTGTGVWALEAKPSLTGSLVGPDGLRPVAQALVEATRRGAIMSDTGSWRYLRTTSTDAAGRYQLRLDPGVYDVAFLPEGKPLARVDVSGVTVPSEGARLDGRLPDAMVLTGALRDVAGRPFAGVAVEVYEHVDAASTPARVLGAGVTDATGVYRVVVPASVATTTSAARP